ncbi:MAG: TolC family protein [Helicobacteraceae bacterium]|jgi:outer membrane protein TolC|nr:TolC family protein [Helicobacteraceae bacterium]
MKAILTTLIFAATLNALTLDQAIDLALQNRAKIAEAEAAYYAANERENAAIANFLPTIGASQTRYDRETLTSGSRQTTRFYANLNLFAGMGDYAGAKAASWSKDAKRYELDAAKADVVLEAKYAFYGYLKAKDTLAAAQENMKATKKQAKDAQAFFDQGLIGSYEKHAIALEALQSEQTALSALSALQVATLTLQNAIAAPLPSEPIAPKPPQNSALNRDKLNDLTLKNRSEIKSLLAQINAQKEQKTKAVSPALPSADLQIAKEKYEYENGFSGIDEQTTTTITLAWQLPGLVKPYFDREAALYDQRALESRLTDLKRTLQLQLASAFERLLLAEKAFEVARESLKLAEENLRIAQNRFDERIASASELIDADAALWKAKEQYTLYYYDKLLALADLERVTESNLAAR